jgi:UDP-GlcNAc:undecaprenyl-phosphate GlcNAc-1-phosphate transferase
MASLLVGGLLCSLFVAATPMRFLFFLLPTLLTFAVGLIDDLFGLAAHLKLILICILASVVTLQLPGVLVGSAVILIIAVVLLTNAVNLLDGANGLAGGAMSLSFVGLGTLFFLHRDCSMAAVCFLAVPAIIGFLILNLGGRIFMGDCGSLMLGFLAATAVVRANSLGIHAAAGAILCVAVPLLDLCFVIGRRLTLGVPVLSGDLNHGYNVLMRRFGSPRLMLAVYYIATILLAASGILIAGG